MTPFIEGGWTMYPILACALMAHPLAIAAVVGAFFAKRRALAIGFASAALLTALTTAAVGVFGYFYAMNVVNAALATVDPAAREMLHAEGQREASWNLICGALGCALPLLLAIAGLVRGFTLGDRRAASR